MRQVRKTHVSEVALPWSDGLLSARIKQVGERTVALVPELGLHCYGSSQTEAVFRLFTILLKYYRQLHSHQIRLNEKGKEHLKLLSVWVEGIESRMKMSSDERQILSIVGAKH